MKIVDYAMEMVHANTKDERAVHDFRDGKITATELKSTRDECWRKMDDARRQLQAVDDELESIKKLIKARDSF